jgi:hypothetical protein
VGYGSGALAAVDGKGTKTGGIPLDADPESFRLEPHATIIFVNLPESRKIAVVDRKARSVITTWTTDDARARKFLDGPRRYRSPPLRRVPPPSTATRLDIDSGHIVGTWSAVEGCDDIFYDPCDKANRCDWWRRQNFRFATVESRSLQRDRDYSNEKGCTYKFFLSGNPFGVRRSEAARIGCCRHLRAFISARGIRPRNMPKQQLPPVFRTRGE